MKFLKTFKINNKKIKDKSLIYRADQQIIMDSVVSLRLPTGTGDPAYAPGTTENQRPNLPYAQNGLLRYNLSLNAMEVLQQGIWYQIKTKTPVSIVRQIFIPTPAEPLTGVTYVNGEEIHFGPLKGQNDLPPFGPNNILVYIENVPQMPITNYNTVDSTDFVGLTGKVYPQGLYLEFSSPVPLGKTVTVLHGFD